MCNLLKAIPLNPLRLVNLDILQKASDQVSVKLDRLGFYDKYLEDIQVFLVPFGTAYGYQLYGGDRSICIPMLSGSRLTDIFACRETSLNDVLLHEYGHALADTHRGLIHSKRFSSVFGGSHQSEKRSAYDPELHVTKYAATNPSEDFAEVFWSYVKHNCKLPKEYRNPTIRRKWHFVDRLRIAVNQGRRRW